MKYNINSRVSSIHYNNSIGNVIKIYNNIYEAFNNIDSANEWLSNQSKRFPYYTLHGTWYLVLSDYGGSFLSPEDLLEAWTDKYYVINLN